MKVNQFIVFVGVFLLGILFSHVMGKGLIEGKNKYKYKHKKKGKSEISKDDKSKNLYKHKGKHLPKSKKLKGGKIKNSYNNQNLHKKSHKNLKSRDTPDGRVNCINRWAWKAGCESVPDYANCNGYTSADGKWLCENNVGLFGVKWPWQSHCTTNYTYDCAHYDPCHSDGTCPY